MSENIRFFKSKVINLRGPSNSLLFFKQTGGARLQVFKKNGRGGGPAPMDGTPMSTGISVKAI